MKTFALPLLTLSLSYSVISSPVYGSQTQQPLGVNALEEHLRFVPEGFDIDLDAKRLVKFAYDAKPIVMTEREKILSKANGLRFIDVTDSADVGVNLVAPKSSPTYGTYNVTSKVQKVIKTLSTTGPLENLQKFSGFRTRFYRSDTGRESQLWLLSKIKEIVSKHASSDLKERISVHEFEHSWAQNSLILNIKGTGESDEGKVIISAHQDSTNLFPFLGAPGADDDGSGTVTILEALRGLLAADYKPVNDVEFHWYSAEEGGLLGSQAVVKDYVSRSEKIFAQLQFDMTAWVKKGTKEEVGVITDYTDPSLTDFVKSLIEDYLDIPWVNTKCGYACSDHASWSNAGYPGAFGIESTFENSNKNVHSLNDRLDISPEFSFDHMLEFSKLAVAYVIESAGWSEE